MTLDKFVLRFAVELSLCLWMVGDAAAIQITLNLVQSQSTMLFDGDFLGTEANPANPFFAQDDATFPTPGTTDGDPTRPSNLTSLTGTITVDVDNVMAPTTIQILSADMDGTVTGSWLPEVQPQGANCDPMTGQTDGCSSVHPPGSAAPADVGVKLVGFDCCDTAYAAVRDFAYNLVTEIPDPDGGGPLTATPVVEPVNALGEFSSLSQNIVYRRGFFDYWADPFILDERARDDLTGDDGLNQHTYVNNPSPTPDTVTPIPNAPKSTYVVLGNLVTLTIPVEINSDDLNPGGLSRYFDGQFVATFEIPAGLTGDHNGDGIVDAADYAYWRKTGVGGPQGYLDWQANFGEPSGSGAGSGGVPEPASAALAIVGLACVSFGRRRKGR